MEGGYGREMKMKKAEVLERVYKTGIYMFEWKQEEFSSNEEVGFLILHLCSSSNTGVKKDKYVVKQVSLHLLFSRDFLPSLIDTIRSAQVFLEDTNALILSEAIFWFVVGNFQLTSMPNSFASRKSKIVIVATVFVKRFADEKVDDGDSTDLKVEEEAEDKNLMDDANDNSNGSNMVGEKAAYYLEARKKCHLDIVSMLRRYLNIELPVGTHEPADVLKKINPAVKTNRLIGHCRPPADMCPICLQEFLTGAFVTTTPCSHVFHSHCMSTWLLKNKSCPMCRSLCATVVHI